MARVNREDWIRNLNVGDKASATLPGGKDPEVGKVVSVEYPPCDSPSEFPIVGVALAGKEWVFHSGHLAGHPSILLQPVATGAGGSVGLPMNVSNIVERAEKRNTA
jgi:hypothetical protein